MKSRLKTKNILYGLAIKTMGVTENEVPTSLKNTGKTGVDLLRKIKTAAPEIETVIVNDYKIFESYLKRTVLIYVGDISSTSSCSLNIPMNNPAQIRIPRLQPRQTCIA